MSATAKQITVKDTIIHITQHNKEDYISLTDMLKYKENLSMAERAVLDYLIENKAVLKDFYVEMRRKAEMEGAPVPISLRQFKRLRKQHMQVLQVL